MTIADPDTVGLFSFAFGTFIVNMSTLGFYSLDTQVLFAGMILGGFGQLLAGLQDYKRNNLFGSTAFTGFGLFWITYGLVNLAAALKWLPPADATVGAWYTALWAVFTLGLVGASLKLNKVLTVTLAFVFLLLLFLSLGTWLGRDMLTKLGAACGVISAVMALYLGLAQIWNATFGRTVLPVLDWKK